MLTAQTIALDCLSYIGEFTLDCVNAHGTASGVILARIARDINASLQEIASRRPDLFRQRLGATVAAPETQTVTAITNSTALAFGTAFTNNLEGVTCNIGGQWNELRGTGNTATLLNPYMGPGGTVAMTVYGDSILLDSATCSRVIGNVDIWGDMPLLTLTNRTEFLRYGSVFCSDYGRTLVHSGPTARRAGIPEAWWAETYLAADKSLKVRLRLTPLPDRAIPVAFDVATKPANITPDDFGTDGSDPGRTCSVPGQMDETLLLPLILARWSMSPWFKDAENRAALSAAAVDARRMLSDFRAQSQTGATITVVGYN